LDAAVFCRFRYALIFVSVFYCAGARLAQSRKTACNIFIMTALDYLQEGFSQLDRDLRFLIECFAEVLRELGHGDLAEWLPWRGASTPPGAPPPRLSQALSIAFQLLNMVEENAAADVRRAREREENLQAEQGLWAHQLERLKNRGVRPEQVAAMISQVCVEPVLTAHPTEAKRLSVLEVHRELYALLEKHNATDTTPLEKARTRDDIKAGLERLWRTGEILLARPTLDDERRNVLHYLREVFPRVVPRLDARLKAAWSEAGYDEKILASADSLPKLRFGTWVGGDRDGHPLVTAQVTARTLSELRYNAAQVLDRELKTLARRLSLTAWVQAPPSALAKSTKRLVALLGDEAQPILQRFAEEPWRQYVELMRLRLPREYSPSHLPSASEENARARPYRSTEELKSDLEILRAALEECGAERLARHDVDPVLRILDTFGFHLARLDIRQNSAFHERAITQFLKACAHPALKKWGANYDAWAEDARLEFLNEELLSPRPFLPPGVALEKRSEAAAVLDCYRALARWLGEFGPDGIGSLIVSMTRQTSDLLLVYVLAREAGLLVREGASTHCRLPVVPLLETGDDLERGPGLLRAFLQHPITRATLDAQQKATGKRMQQVMIGYSDSNKDVGLWAAQWDLQRAQQELGRVGRETGVEICFFHGRGGTISRGAGPTHRFLDALPHGTLGADVRLTEQGETIAQKYAHLETATYNLESLLAGVAATTVLHRLPPRTAPGAWDTVAETLARASEATYRALLETDGFIPFFRQATPIDALEASRIGSRPPRRSARSTQAFKLSDLRAIPWVFSWNQARYYLPGWFGIGTALETLKSDDHDNWEKLKSELRGWSFGYYVLTNVETNLASTDEAIMREYSLLVEDEAVRERIWKIIRAERERTRIFLEELRGASIAAQRPRMSKTLALRADALRALHTQQIKLLRRWRELKKQEDFAAADALLPDVLLEVNAIASGLRTTG
jgi:phosphoenolpyruvate carboxylase